MLRPPFVFAILALLPSAGCATTDSSSTTSSQTTRRDSAGIEIVESATPRWTDAERWRVEMDPEIDIGGVGSADELLRFADPIRLPDGRLLIGDSPASFKYFDAAGRHDTTIKRHGEGPGEVEAIDALLHYRGDSLLVSTGTGVMSTETGSSRGRVRVSSGYVDATILGRDLGFGRNLHLTWATPPSPPAGTVTIGPLSDEGLQGVTRDGSLVVRGDGTATLEGRSGLRWSLSPYYRFSADGSRMDTIAFLPTWQIQEEPGQSPPHRWVFFGRKAPLAVMHDRLMYWGNGDAFEIWTFDVMDSTPGLKRPARIVRYALPNRIVNRSIRDSALSLMIQRSRTAADSVRNRTMYEDLPALPTLPAFQTIAVDATGNLWVEHFRLTALGAQLRNDSEQNLWSVFDSTGILLGDIITPPGLKIREIGDDWLLGIWKDADDVEHVRLHRIVKE